MLKHPRCPAASCSSRCTAGWCCRPPVSGPTRHPRGSCIVQSSRGQQECHVLVGPGTASPPSAPTCSTATCKIPIAVAATLMFGAAYWFKRQAELPKRKLPEPWPEIPLPEHDPKAYQLALARTRQAQYVQKAVAYMKAGQPARGLVELQRAMEENAVCRTPLLDGHHTSEELEDLYRLHIKHTEVPPKFATLLQLRELLSISDKRAEAIEEDILAAGASFSI